MRRSRPAGEREAYARLEKALLGADMASCDGCTSCATRCTDGVEISYPEFERLVAHVLALPRSECERVLSQDKRLRWWEDVTIAMCPLLDMEQKRCVAYAARPLICRLFGFAPWLPCPTGRAPGPLPNALALLTAYLALERRTLREWLRRTHISLPGMGPE